MSNYYSVKFKLSDSNEEIKKFNSLQGAMQMKRKIEDENSNIDYVEILDSENETVTKYISDSVLINDVDLAVGSVYLDENNNEWQITKVEGDKYVININETTDNKINKTVFEKMIGNDLKPAQALTDSFEKQEEFTKEELAELEKSVFEYLKKKQIFPEDGTVSNSKVMSKNFFDITLVIDGDWKHDHIACDRAIEDWVAEHNFELVGSSEEEIGDSQDDSYEAEHIYHIGKDKEFAQSMKKLIVGDTKIDHNKGFSKGFYEKLNKQLEKNLEDLDEFEIVLDSDDEEDYVYQKNALKREVRRQINEYNKK